MRSGKIFVKGNAGYRVGIHMKEYHEFYPKIIIGGKVGDFLGEYQAGGIIVVLGIGCDGKVPVGSFWECTAVICISAVTKLPKDSPYRFHAKSQTTATRLISVNMLMNLQRTLDMTRIRC